MDVEGIKGSNSTTYGSSLSWLIEAGVISKCHNVKEPAMPLSFNRDFDAFKVFMKDTGLLVSMMEDGDAREILRGDSHANGGKIAENAVAGEIERAGRMLMYFERKGKLKIDFVMNIDCEIAAIEVKSGNNTKSKSLDSLMSEKYGVPRGMKLERTNIMIDESGVEHYPLFASAFLFRERDLPAADMSRIRNMPSV